MSTPVSIFSASNEMAARNLPGSFGAAARVVGSVGDRARANLGEREYERARGRTTWGLAITSGFLPITPFLIPFQIGLIIVLFIMLLFFGQSFSKQTLFIAYLCQAVITAIAYHFVLDTGGRAVFGV